MTTLRRALLIPAVAVSLVLAPALVGCSMNPLESVIEGATGGNLDLGGTTIPDDFPADVPLFDGEVVSVFGVGKDADKVWTVIVKVPEVSAADDIASQLEGAGFSQEFDQAAGGATGSAYSKGEFGVLVAVTEDGNNGWVATYVVTPAGA